VADPKFITFADKVAASLGMTLDETRDVSWHDARITDGMGRGYRLAPVRDSSTRVEISAVYPQTSYWFDDDDGKPITCARTRGPEAVAADITRRLAPGMRPCWPGSATWMPSAAPSMCGLFVPYMSAQSVKHAR
jgi:hypothetical protein